MRKTAISLVEPIIHLLLMAVSVCLFDDEETFARICTTHQCNPGKLTVQYMFMPYGEPSHSALEVPPYPEEKVSGKPISC